MNKSILRDWKTWVCFVPVLLGLLVFVYFTILMGKGSHVLCFKSIDPFLYSQLTSNYGDFISGTVGLLFTLTATFFLFVSMAEQRKQTQETREDTKRSQHENTYFNMLAMLDNVLTSVDNNIIASNNDNIETLSAYYRRIKESYDAVKASDENLNILIQDVTNSAACNYKITKLKDETTKLFEKDVDSLNCNVGFFYRFIYNAVKYVTDETITDEKKKKQYLNILKAQLSDEALALLFYDAMSKFGQNKDGFNDFYNILDRLSFFENIQETILLERCHYKFYPHTSFRFLNFDELHAINL